MICKKVSVSFNGGKVFKLLVDENNLIINRYPVPLRNDFIYSDLKEFYGKYKGKAEFKVEKELPYPPTADDVYRKMKEKNPSLKYLKRMIEGEVY